MCFGSSGLTIFQGEAIHNAIVLSQPVVYVSNQVIAVFIQFIVVGITAVI